MRLAAAIALAMLAISGLQGYAVGTVAGGVAHGLFDTIDTALKGTAP